MNEAVAHEARDSGVLHGRNAAPGVPRPTAPSLAQRSQLVRSWWWPLVRDGPNSFI